MFVDDFRESLGHDKEDGKGMPRKKGRGFYRRSEAMPGRVPSKGYDIIDYIRHQATPSRSLLGFWRELFIEPSQNCIHY